MENNKQKRLVFNVSNCHLRKKPCKKFGPSKTIPGKSFSIDQLLKKHQRGMAVPVATDPFYEEDDAPSNGINPLTLDLVDVQAYKLENERKINELKTKKESYDKEQRKKADELAKEKAAFDAWWKEQKKKPSDELPTS